MSTGPHSVRGIICRHFAEFAASRRLRAEVIRTADRIQDCQTATLGEYIERCDCGHIRRTKFRSCRDRCCPQCSGGRRAGWLERVAEQLLPCDHVHVIFTVPEELNGLWRYNRSRFARLLMTAARQSLLELLADDKYLGAQPGVISVFHSWGRNLSVHPHVHCLVTAGGLNRHGQFVEQKRTTLLPARVLMRVFRGKLREALKHSAGRNELAIPPRLTPTRLQSLLNRLGVTDWNVRVEPRMKHGVAVAGYLARYLTGGPISDRRLTRVTDGEIAFEYKDFQKGTTRTFRLAPHEFLARWFEHVPPRGLRTVRRSGLYANCHAQTRQRIQQQLLAAAGSDPETHSRQPPVTGLETETCPLCNTPVAARDERPVRPFRARATPVPRSARPTRFPGVPSQPP